MGQSLEAPGSRGHLCQPETRLCLGLPAWLQQATGLSHLESHMGEFRTDTASCLGSSTGMKGDVACEPRVPAVAWAAGSELGLELWCQLIRVRIPGLPLSQGVLVVTIPLHTLTFAPLKWSRYTTHTSRGSCDDMRLNVDFLARTPAHSRCSLNVSRRRQYCMDGSRIPHCPSS